MRLLVLAPHPDDEILGCTGLMLRTAKSDGTVHVVVVTGGQLAADRATRECETQAALSLLGLPEAEFWGYPDGALPMGAEIRSRYLKLVRTFRPSYIALPSPTEAHPDHRRLAAVAIAQRPADERERDKRAAQQDRRAAECREHDPGHDDEAACECAAGRRAAPVAGSGHPFRVAQPSGPAGA